MFKLNILGASAGEVLPTTASTEGTGKLPK